MHGQNTVNILRVLQKVRMFHLSKTGSYADAWLARLKVLAETSMKMAVFCDVQSEHLNSTCTAVSSSLHRASSLLKSFPRPSQFPNTVPNHADPLLPFLLQQTLYPYPSLPHSSIISQQNIYRTTFSIVRNFLEVTIAWFGLHAKWGVTLERHEEVRNSLDEF
jgi:hypothetical protein